VADLDAIEGRSTNDELVPELARRGFRAWVDAGITDPGRVRRTLEAGAERVIVGLETLSGAAALAKIAEADTRGRLAFSLDLRDGRPIVGAPDLVGATPLELAARAHDAGYRTVIVLDLGRVGGLGGPAQDVLPELRARFPEMELIIGGGVGGLDDLRDAAARGCDGALVGTAIHTDRITRREIERVRDL
jgi:phosphoribosylformimino-5-aminoimidazole carboxamide ribotide isomerase